MSESKNLIKGNFEQERRIPYSDIKWETKSQEVFCE